MCRIDMKESTCVGLSVCRELAVEYVLHSYFLLFSIS